MLILLQLWASKSAEMASTGDISGKLKSSSDIVLHRQDGKGEQSAKNRLSDIERLVKGNKFSRYINLIYYRFIVVIFFHLFLVTHFIILLWKLFILSIKLFFTMRCSLLKACNLKVIVFLRLTFFIIPILLDKVKLVALLSKWKVFISVVIFLLFYWSPLVGVGIA